MPSSRRRALTLAALACTLPRLSAQTAFPNRPVKLVVPFATGGSTDLIARLLAERMGALLGQPVVVDNRAGAGGMLGADAVAKAAPDGYTLLVGTVSTHGASPAIYKKLSYDPVRDFQPITNVASIPSVFMVHPRVAAADLRAFVELARAAPGRYAYASPGTGSLGHAHIAYLAQLAGIRLLHVPYKGAGPAMNDALAGQVDAITDNLPTALPHLQSGRLKPLAVLAPQRSRLLPQVGTYREAGFEDLSEAGWFGLLAPARTPAPVVQRLLDAAHRAMQDPGYVSRTEAIGALPMANQPEQFATQILAAGQRYQRIAQLAHIQPD